MLIHSNFLIVVFWFFFYTEMMDILQITVPWRDRSKQREEKTCKHNREETDKKVYSASFSARHEMQQNPHHSRLLSELPLAYILGTTICVLKDITKIFSPSTLKSTPTFSLMGIQALVDPLNASSVLSYRPLQKPSHLTTK